LISTIIISDLFKIDITISFYVHERMLPNNKLQVDFEKELRTNFTGYNIPLTRWWNIRACNKSHCNAYRNIANYVITQIDIVPSLVIDYGCGTGRAPNLLNRIKLLKAPLPSKLLLEKRADLVTFTFPHILSNLYHLDLNSFLEFLTYSEIENAVILAEGKGVEELSKEQTDEDPDI
jgi:hypothetical protein